MDISAAFGARQAVLLFVKTCAGVGAAFGLQLAALAVKDAEGNYTVSLDDTAGVNYTAFKLGDKPLPWRSCLATFQPPNTSTQMGFDSLTVPHNPDGDPAATMRDYRDFMTYDQSTQGHLNSDGLCFVERYYPSPP